MAAKEKTQVTRRRFTVHEYHRMAEAGIPHEDDRVELIDGEVVEMDPIGGRHANCVRNLNRVLSGQVGDDVLIDVQNPIRLDEHREPRTDLGLRHHPRLRQGSQAPALRRVRYTRGVDRGSHIGDRRTPHRTTRKRIPPHGAGRKRREHHFRRPPEPLRRSELHPRVSRPSDEAPTL